MAQQRRRDNWGWQRWCTRDRDTRTWRRTVASCLTVGPRACERGDDPALSTARQSQGHPIMYITPRYHDDLSLQYLQRSAVKMFYHLFQRKRTHVNLQDQKVAEWLAVLLWPMAVAWLCTENFHTTQVSAANNTRSIHMSSVVRTELLFTMEPVQ